MKVAVGRSFVLAVASLMVFLGGFIFWQQVNQPSANGCYTFPFGFSSMTAGAYQGSCPFNSLPNYYASDVALTLIAFGFLVTLVRLRKGRVDLGQ